jgi:hypothetical protein
VHQPAAACLPAKKRERALNFLNAKPTLFRSKLVFILRYLAPLQAFLRNFPTTTAKQQLVAYVDESRRAYEAHAFVDPNAAVLYGLSLLSLGFYSPTELTEGSPRMRLASALQQQVLVSSPTHPGALHFFIHSVDQPTSTPAAAVAAAEAYFASNSAVHPLIALAHDSTACHAIDYAMSLHTQININGHAM